jgi:putative membrane protein insertion efficiency factor
MKRVWQIPARLVGLGLIGLVRVYQWTISPLAAALFGPACRFYPSCSQYFILAVRKHGPVRGSIKGIGRVCRCHPWHPGGIDWP